MNTRQRILAVLNYENYDRLPIVHFGFLEATLKKWAAEGHFNLADYPSIYDGSPDEDALSRKLGFHGNYHRIFAPHARIWPMFEPKVGPHYKRITDLLRRHGIDLISLDCDGMIDHLIPTWIENGVNVIFPIEVGTWHASLALWREKYGKTIRGVGGMDKRVFKYDYAAVDAEIERLKRLVDLGGYLPCTDHRIASDAKRENVQYYCDRMRQTFG